MRKIIPIVSIFIAFLLFQCQEGKNPNEVHTGSGLGGVYYGGIFKLNEVDNIKSLMPLAINEVASFHLASQVYEGLVKYDQTDLKIVPAIARSWEISADAKQYTFHIRSDVRYHDDPCFSDSIGRAVTASDIKFCFENLCSKSINNTQYDVTFKDRVEGAHEFFSESKSGQVRVFSGITVVDDSTLVIKLIQSDANFLNILAMPGCFIYPKEAYTKYGSDEMRLKCVGTGPFYIDSAIEGTAIVMKRNMHYWGRDKFGNQLPFLDAIKWTFVPDKKTEVMEFRNGNLDMIYRIPVEMFHEIFGEMQSDKKGINFDIYSSPALSTHYYGFNLQTNPFFSLKEIRLAFNLAIDRHKIADYTIKGEGRSADYGIVPFTESFEASGYNYKGLRGYKYNPDSARKLLEIAGYGDGKGLPEFNLEINSGGGDRNILVALAIQKMLKENLHVNVNMDVVSWPEHIDNIQSGKSDFFRYAWVSDYPDPESFLTLFYGKHVPANFEEKSYVNFTRFKNKRFDSLFVAARGEIDKKKRYNLFSQAEQIVLDEGAFMPLFYDENLRLTQKTVRNLPENPLNYIDLAYTYFIPKNK